MYPEIALIHRYDALINDEIAGVARCLPSSPHQALVQLALASTEQLNLTLSLVHHTVARASTPALNESHALWCMSLSKALSPDMRLTEDNPLQLLCNWVTPAAWQRLRLRFPCEQVLAVEEKSPVFESACSRLITLWQAVVWRATSMRGHDKLADSHTPGD